MQDYTHSQVQYAGFIRRLLAFLIDLLWVSLISTLLIIGLFGAESLQAMQNLSSLQDIDWRITVIEQIVPAVWAIGFWIVWKATPGKLLFDCQIVNADTLQCASPGRLVIRYLGYILSSLPLGLGFLWIVIDKRNQGWHDKLANTVVIMEDYSLLPLERLS